MLYLTTTIKLLLKEESVIFHLGRHLFSPNKHLWTSIHIIHFDLEFQD